MTVRLYIIIVGAGKVGWNLARELLERGDEVTVIEQDRRRYLTVEQELEHAVQYGDATELWVLERAGIQRADLVVEGEIAIDTPLEQTRRLVPEALVPLIQRMPGVAGVEGR